MILILKSNIFLNYNPIPIIIADYTYDKMTAHFGRVNNKKNNYANVGTKSITR
jgi:hypothetical protein